MGIVNVTPDSFSDGGRFLAPDRAIAHARELAADGADLLDIGGESTRPGAREVTAEEELARVVPVLEGIRGVDAAISIDTSKAAVAEAALDAGAEIVNDVTALRHDPELAGLCAERECGVVLMHMQGTPRTMQENPTYDDVVDDVKAFLAERIEFAVGEGIAEERIWVDPGIGFGKTVDHNLELLRRLGELRELGRPVVVGTSRKRFIGKLTGREVDDRLGGTIASNVLALRAGADVLRVHDVAEIAAGARWWPGRSSTRPPALGAPAAGTVRAPWRQTDRPELVRRGRDPRPLDLHPSRGHRGRAGDRAAPRDRRQLRRPRLRRGAHRPPRGHGRLRGGVRHRRARRHRAQLQDARAALPRDRGAADGAVRVRVGSGAGRQAGAAAAARGRGGGGRGRPRARGLRGGRGRRRASELRGSGTSAWARTSAIARPICGRRSTALARARGRGRGGLVDLRDRAGRRGARPAGLPERGGPHPHRARARGAARPLQGDRGGAGAGARRASATARARWTSTCCCSATSSSRPSG